MAIRTVDLGLVVGPQGPKGDGTMARITIPAGRVRGDIDGDGIVTYTDADLLNSGTGSAGFRYFNVEFSAKFADGNVPIDYLAADVDGNGEINGYDSTQIMLIWDRYGITTKSTDILGHWVMRTGLDTQQTYDWLYHTDIPVAGMTAGMSAVLVLDSGSEAAAGRCGICRAVECGTGYVRVYTMRCPVTALSATLVYGPGDGTGTVLDAAKPRTCRAVVGTKTAGWTAQDCDYLCDGVADDVEISAAIAALPSAGGTVLLLDGTYQLDDPIVASGDKVMVIGRGTTTVIKGNEGDRKSLFSVSANTLTLQSLTLKLLSSYGNVDDMSFRMMELAGNAQSIALVECTMEDVCSNFMIVLDGAPSHIEMKGCRLTIRDSAYFNSIALVVQSEVLITGCYLERGLSGITGGVITGNAIIVESEEASPSISGKGHIVISGNKIKGTKGIQWSGPGTISGNDILLIGYDPIGISVRPQNPEGNYIDCKISIIGNVISYAGEDDPVSVKLFADTKGCMVVNNILCSEVTDIGTNNTKTGNIVSV